MTSFGSQLYIRVLLQSAFSVIILDDIERLLEYVSIGPRFSNTILQALLVLLKRQPPQGRKLLVLGTTSNAAVMEEMEVASTFNVVLHVPKLKEAEIAAVLQTIHAFAANEVGCCMHSCKTCSVVMFSTGHHTLCSAQVTISCVLSRPGTAQAGNLRQTGF